MALYLFALILQNSEMLLVIIVFIILVNFNQGRHSKPILEPIFGQPPNHSTYFTLSPLVVYSNISVELNRNQRVIHTIAKICIVTLNQRSYLNTV